MREDDPDHMRLASSAIGADDRSARAEVHLGFEPRRALHPPERHGRSGSVLLEQPPHAVVADRSGGRMLDREVLMDPLGRQPSLPLLEKPCEPRARRACLAQR